MKKKVLSIVLVLALVFTCFTACGKKEADPTPTTQPTATQAPTSTPVPTAAAEALPEAKYHWGFDGNDTGIVSVVRRDKNDTETANTDFGGTYGIEAAASYTDKDGNVFSTDALYADGPVGKCLYLNGNFGLKLDNFKGMADESYTISFWVNADRLSTFGPVIQLGHNVAMNSSVSWINFTQSEWGTSSAKIFPVVWNRNVDDNGAFPWFYASDDAIHGKKEWVLVTLVADGQTYTYGEGDSAYTLVNSTLYLNGEQVFYSDMSAYGGLATEVISDKFADSTELLIGINYWDSLFKGYIDELYIYEEALTAGQVQTLFQQGDATVKSTAPTAEQLGTVEVTPTPEVAEGVNVSFVMDGSHIVLTETVGAEDNSAAWWTAFSKIHGVAAGESATVNFKMTSSLVNNWNTFALCLQSTATGHAATTPGYKEYAVVRADKYGWGEGYNAEGSNFSATASWLSGSTDEAVTNKEWADWLSVMNGADVTVTITNNNGTADVDIKFIGTDGKEYTESYKGLVTEAGDIYYCLIADGSHFVITETVGAEDNSAGWWTTFSTITGVEQGATETFTFKNYSSKANNWNNFNVVLQSTGVGHANTTPGYREYAVVRSDKYGWGTGYSAEGMTSTASWLSGSTDEAVTNKEWADWLAVMDGADVTVAVTNNGATIDVNITIIGTDGKTYTESYTGISTAAPIE